MLTKRLHSPVLDRRDFVWVASYSDGWHYAEFDFETKEENDFYKIERDKLIRFGLVGHGMQLFFETFGGTFRINGNLFDFAYRTDEKTYPLTSYPQLYNDIITYKNAESFFSSVPGIEMKGDLKSHIFQYNFGFKTKLSFEDGTKFNFKAICSIPFNAPIFFYVRLVANRALSGDLLIGKNEKVFESVPAPLDENVGGEMNWVVR